MLWAAAVLLGCAAADASGQTFDATDLHKPHDLSMPWLIHGGDDPAYARPDFDDSQWASFNPSTSLKKFIQDRPSVVWYRLHMKVDPKDTDLALSELNISRAFEVYVNGERLMGSGRVAPYVAYTSAAKVLARIPKRAMATGALVIALRVHVSESEWINTEEPGYYANNLMLGRESELYAKSWLSLIGENTVKLTDELLLVGLGLVALVLYVTQRRQAAYLWIAMVGLMMLAELPEPLIAAVTNIPLFWEVLSDLLRLASPFVWAALYFSFVHQRIGLRWLAFLLLAGIGNTISALGPLVGNLPVWLGVIASMPYLILLAIVIPIVLAIHFKRGNREAGILLIPALLFSLYIYCEVGFKVLFQFPKMSQMALRGLYYIDQLTVGPFTISLNSISGISSTVALALIMLRRSITTSRRQAILEGELLAAQQVQEVLVPEEIESVPGFDIETAYEPAQQVGGDFFQIVPTGKGGLLVVVGDVAGKGLPAAMLVSVLVGAIRGVADYTSDPEELLSSLNERLVGRGGGGFSTALVAHITADGWVTIANAGHLSPYLDGREMELHGALPLGVMSGTTYETSNFYLAHGSRLTFYSDGVVEAQNETGELFGFDRAKEISTQDAAEIVQAAKAFGQEDDITVVTVTREAAFATAA